MTLCLPVSAHVVNKRPFQGPLGYVFVLFVGDLADGSGPKCSAAARPHIPELRESEGCPWREPCVPELRAGLRDGAACCELTVTESATWYTENKEEEASSSAHEATLVATEVATEKVGKRPGVWIPEMRSDVNLV